MRHVRVVDLPLAIVTVRPAPSCLHVVSYSSTPCCSASPPAVQHSQSLRRPTSTRLYYPPVPRRCAQRSAFDTASQRDAHATLSYAAGAVVRALRASSVLLSGRRKHPSVAEPTFVGVAWSCIGKQDYVAASTHADPLLVCRSRRRCHESGV